jgi:hypothetical protein
VNLPVAVHAPTQVTEAQFRESIQADRRVRGDTG